MTKVANSVLLRDAHYSTNFYKSDLILKHYLEKYLKPNTQRYITPHLNKLGESAAQEMDDLSQRADKQRPVLKKRDRWGNSCSNIEFHPSYRELLEIAAKSEMIHVKYEPTLRKRFASNTHQMGFAAGQLYAMSELGVYCPLCMTDGAAHLIDKYAPNELKKRLLPHLASNNVANLYTGAMYLTEKSGGSDVGRNLTRATQVKGRTYELNGEKWFCSNANADVVLALARTGAVSEGIRGLSLFLVEQTPEKNKNKQIEIIRLKDKLGVCSMATAEVKFHNADAYMLGQQGKGFNLMADMINISRLYNAVAALGGARRALIEVYQYLNHRVIFGRKAIEHALIRQKFTELGALNLANFLLVWRTIRAMDNSKGGDQKETDLLRILIPMAKWWSAEHAVYTVRECMELMGGNGYIEDFIMPKLLRDVNVLPIWEGSGNVIVLDIMRALKKSGGHHLMIQTIKNQIPTVSDANNRTKIESCLEVVEGTLSKLPDLDKDQAEATAKPFFKQLIHLYQIALMLEYHDSTSSRWVDPALPYLISLIGNNHGHGVRVTIKKPLPISEVHNLVAWDY